MSDPGYYFLPGDYARDTAHLTNDEDLAYRRLLDCYYSRGAPFPESVAWLRRVAKVPLEAVQVVADEFFPVNGDGLRHNRRADEEIKKRADYLAAQAERGRLSWEARKGRGQTTALTTVRTGVRAETNGGSIPVRTGARTGDEPPYPSPLPSPTPTPKPSRTKKPVSEVKPSDAAFGLSEFFLGELKLRFPNLKTPNMAAWAKDCDRMIRLDNRDPKEAEELIRWMAGDFWGAVVLCPGKLREKWDQIAAKKAGSNGNGSVSAAQRDKYAHLEEKC